MTRIVAEMGDQEPARDMGNNVDDGKGKFWIIKLSFPIPYQFYVLLGIYVFPHCFAQ